jgi:hypothetical protein
MGGGGGLYILIFTFLDGGMKTRYSELQTFPTFYRQLTSPSIQLRFPTAVLKHLKAATFYKDSSDTFIFCCNFIKQPTAVPWLRRLVAGLSPRRPGFIPRLVHVGFVW